MLWRVVDTYCWVYRVRHYLNSESILKTGKCIEGCRIFKFRGTHGKPGTYWTAYISVWETYHTKLHAHIVLLMMNTWWSKHVEDAKNLIKRLIWKVCICWFTLRKLTYIEAHIIISFSKNISNTVLTDSPKHTPPGKSYKRHCSEVTRYQRTPST